MSTAKSINDTPQVNSLQPTNNLIITNEGGVGRIPVASFVASRAKGIEVTSLRANGEENTSDELKQRLVDWADAYPVGSICVLRLGPGWTTAIKQPGAAISKGSAYGGILMARQKENSGALYFSALFTSYDSDSAYIFRYSNGEWRFIQFTGTVL